VNIRTDNNKFGYNNEFGYNEFDIMNLNIKIINFNTEIIMN